MEDERQILDHHQKPGLRLSSAPIPRDPAWRIVEIAPRPDLHMYIEETFLYFFCGCVRHLRECELYASDALFGLAMAYGGTLCVIHDPPQGSRYRIPTLCVT